MATYLQIRTRTTYLRGETDFLIDSTTTAINSHINASVQEAVNAFNYSWTQTTNAVLSFDSTGTLILPTDYNPRWHVPDLRIVSTSMADIVFDEIPIRDQGVYTSADYKYWIVYDNTGKRYNLKSKTLSSATLQLTYHFIPTDMTADGDVCVIPDIEAISYLAAAKNWIGDERNQSLQQNFESEAQTRLKALYTTDLAFSAIDTEGSIIDNNPQLAYRY